VVEGREATVKAGEKGWLVLGRIVEEEEVEDDGRMWEGGVSSRKASKSWVSSRKSSSLGKAKMEIRFWRSATLLTARKISDEAGGGGSQGGEEGRARRLSPIDMVWPAGEKMPCESRTVGSGMGVADLRGGTVE
jgi:hypothetical protein